MARRIEYHEGLQPAERRWDIGLHSYLSAVYLRMAGGVAISGLTAWFAAHDSVVAHALFSDQGLTGLGWIVTIAPLGFVLLLSGAIQKLSVATAGGLFVAYAALVGLSLGSLFMVYSGSTIATTFVGAAAGFAALAWMGTITGRDVSGFSAFFTLGLVGLVVAMAINLFLGSPTLDLALSALGLLLFSGLVAVDAQRLKRQFQETTAEGQAQYAVLGALLLYLDFLNIFLFLMRFTGNRHR